MKIVVASCIDLIKTLGLQTMKNKQAVSTKQIDVTLLPVCLSNDIEQSNLVIRTFWPP